MKKWSLQWTQFMQLRKEAWKKFRTSRLPVRYSTNWAMKPLTLGAGQLWVHIWFISYIINTHFFQGNIWTHNWPSPNVSGFIAQLVEHRTGIARSRVQTPLKSWFFFSGFFTQLHKLRSLRRSFLHFQFTMYCTFIVVISENRYLLILTENYAALRIIQQHLLKTSEDAVVIFGSSFPNDQEYTQVKWTTGI